MQPNLSYSLVTSFSKDPGHVQTFGEATSGDENGSAFLFRQKKSIILAFFDQLKEPQNSFSRIKGKSQTDQDWSSKKVGPDINPSPKSTFYV